MADNQQSAGRAALHIALLPWLGFGHMIPFLQLAIALANLGHRISFISTPRNVPRLRPMLPDPLLSLISFIQLPLPRVEGLPEQAESNIEMSSDPGQFLLLRTAFDLLRHPVRDFLSSSSPDWIIRDGFAAWVDADAGDRGVGTVYFAVLHPSVLTFFSQLPDEWRRRWPTPESMTTKPDWIPFPSTVAFKRHEAEFMHRFLATAGAPRTATDVTFDALAVRGCYENGGEHLDLLAKLRSRSPVIPVGLLPPVVLTTSASDNKGGYWGSVFRWLDQRRPRSVVFVSFGSEYKMTEAEVHELASGLEQSGLPFLWALRKPLWLSGDDIDGALPCGFRDRTEGRGIVAVGWAPQPEILAHTAIGGSLFHSGWGSIVETLRHGHVLVLLPFIHDQGLNARFFVEKGLGIEVERDRDGSFNRDEIAKSLKIAMVSDEGEAMRSRAREAASVFADQHLHDEYVRRFADYLCTARIKSDA